MGRKKKQTSTNINDSSSIQYTGTVVIHYIDNKPHKPRSIHNIGKEGMFNFIVRALAGDNIEENRPNFLVAYREENSQERQITVDRISLSSKIVKGEYRDGSFIETTNINNINSVQLQFIIPFTSLKSDEDKINKFKLYDKKGNVCAEVSLDSTQEISIEVNTSILVYWYLTFSNKTN